MPMALYFFHKKPFGAETYLRGGAFAYNAAASHNYD